MNQSQFFIKVKMQEHIKHSALVHHFANNFQQKFKEDLAREETVTYDPCGV
jgi:hypothetical protein